MLLQTNADAFENNHLKVRFSLNLNVSGSCPSLWGCVFPSPLLKLCVFQTLLSLLFQQLLI